MADTRSAAAGPGAPQAERGKEEAMRLESPTGSDDEASGANGQPTDADHEGLLPCVTSGDHGAAQAHAANEQGKEEAMRLESPAGSDDEAGAANGQPTDADHEGLLPRNTSTDYNAVQEHASNDEAAASSASPGFLEKLKSSVKYVVKGALVPAQEEPNDEAERPTNQDEESRGKMVCMTLFTFTK